MHRQAASSSAVLAENPCGGSITDARHVHILLHSRPTPRDAASRYTANVAHQKDHAQLASHHTQAYPGRWHDNSCDVNALGLLLRTSTDEAAPTATGPLRHSSGWPKASCTTDNQQARRGHVTQVGFSPQTSSTQCADRQLRRKQHRNAESNAKQPTPQVPPPRGANPKPADNTVTRKHECGRQAPWPSPIQVPTTSHGATRPPHRDMSLWFTQPSK